MGSTQSKNYRLDKILDKYNLVENFETRACGPIESRQGQCCGIDPVWIGRGGRQNCPANLCPSENPPGMFPSDGKLCCIGMNCNNNGALDPANPCTCTCNPGYAGSDCQYSDAVTCSGHGRAKADGTCECDPDRRGNDCSELAIVQCDRGPDGNDNPICSGHGNADTSRTRDPNGDYSSCACICADGWEGDNCETEQARPCTTGPDGNSATVCSGEGTASGTYSPGSPEGRSTCVCNCIDTYAGPNCEYSDRDTCSGNGLAQDNGTCVCNPGYEGDNCSDGVTCTNGPNDEACQNGTPSGNFPNCTCDCTGTNYQGDHCETPIPCQATDAGAPGYINCHNSDDSRNVADPTQNAVDGCTSCECSDDYTGNNCEFHVDDHCNNHGTADGAGNCTCNAGWTGATCDTGVCQGTNPNGDNYIECQHGGNIDETTSPPNCSCSCTAGWDGDRCEVAVGQSCNSVDLGDGNGVGPIGWDANAGAGGAAVRCVNGNNQNRQWSLNAPGVPDYSTCGNCDCPLDAHGYPMYEGAACDTDIVCTEEDIEHRHHGGCENNGEVDRSRTRASHGGCICDCSRTDYQGDFCESGCQSTDSTAPGYVNCQNGGTPTGTIGNCKCNCPRNYVGDTCDQPATRDCQLTDLAAALNQCNSHGSAMGKVALGADVSQDDTSACACQCDDGYEGNDCNTRSTCGGVAEDGRHCQNGGSAERDAASQNCVCVCASGYVGNHCEMTLCESEAVAAGGLESSICGNGRCAPAGSIGIDLADSTQYCICNAGWQKGEQGKCTQGYDACATADAHARSASLSGFCDGGTPTPHTSVGGLTDCQCVCPSGSHLVSGSSADGNEVHGQFADPTAVDARCVANCPTDAECQADNTLQGCCNSNGNCDGGYPPQCVCTPASGMRGPNCLDSRDYCQENDNGSCGPRYRNECRNNACVCQGRWTKAAGAANMDSCDTLTSACESTPITCSSNGQCVDGSSTLAEALSSDATTIKVVDISSFTAGRTLDGQTPINGELIIQNELISYTGIDTVNNEFTGCIRGVGSGAFDSATTHPSGAQVVEHHSRCQCEPGYSGTNCETAPSICAALHCSQNSTCVVDPGNGLARCQCTNGYSGRRCEVPPDSCDYPINYQCGTCSDGSSTSQADCATAGGDWTSTGTRTRRADGSCYCDCEPGYHGVMCEFTTSTCNAGQCIGDDGTERAIGNNEMCSFNGQCRCKVGFARDQTSNECVALTACDIPGSVIEPFQLESVGDGNSCDNGRGTTSSQGNSCICVCNDGMTKDQEGKCTRSADQCSQVDPASGERTNKCTGQFRTCDAATGQCGCPANYGFDSSRNSCVPTTDACMELGGLTTVSCGAGNLYVYGEDEDGTAQTGSPGRAVSVSGDHGTYGCACACDAGYMSEGESGNCLIPPTASTTKPDGTSCSADIACENGGQAYYLPAGTCSDSRSTTREICENPETGGTCTNRNATNRTDCNDAGGTWTTATWNPYSDGERCVCHCSSGNYSGATCENVCDHLLCENGTKTLNAGVCECVCNDGYEGDRCDVPVTACRRADAPNCNGNGVQREMDDGTCVCQCNEGWTGENCQTQSCPECGQNPVCYDVDGTVMKDDNGNDIVCESTPCTAQDLAAGKRKCDEKGGTFTARGQCVTNAAGVPICECTTGNPKHATGWTGDNCEIPPSGCDAVNCGDHGHCINGQCACDDGYSGPRCEISPRPCDRLDCGESQGRGHCVTEVNAQTGMMEGKCVCEQDYTGLLCQNAPSVCEPNPCQNGTCAQKEGSDPPEALCICPDGYTGTFCEDPPNPCTDNRVCGEHGLCIPVANPDLSVGGMVSSCVCLDGYTGESCANPPNRCTYPSIRDCSGLGLCIDDATNEPIAQQPATKDGCLPSQGHSWEYTNCRDSDGNPVRTTTGNPKDECRSARHDYLGDCVNGQCVCNIEDGFQLSPSGLCTGTAGPCSRFVSEGNRCSENTQRDTNGHVILESDAGGCRCVCTGPTAESITTKRGFAAPNCEEVDIHTWNPNAVEGGNEATQCGAYGTVVEVDGTKYCAPADMREPADATTGIRPAAYGDVAYAGRLDVNGKFSIPPRNQSDQVNENGDDACAPGGVSNSDGTCECKSGYSGDTCQTAPDLCATAGLTGNCQNGGTCIVDSGVAKCECASGYQGRNCENPNHLCDSKDCGGYCLTSDGAPTGAPNKQTCEADGNSWTETGYCYPDPADPSRGSCLCTHGYTKPTHPLDGSVVEDRCTVAPNLCDGKRIHGDCEKDGHWMASVGTEELCQANGGTWHPRGECNPADGSIQCAQITYNLPDGTVKTVNAFRNQHCEDLTSNCLRSGLWDRNKAGAGELCNGNGTCIDGNATVPACKDTSADADPDHPYKPWLLTEAACIAGGGEWAPQATCDCFSGYSGNTCTDKGSVCDGAGKDFNCGVSNGTPTGYCSEHTTDDGEKIANCQCVGGWKKRDGTQGKEGEPPSSAACELGPTARPCQNNNDCRGLGNTVCKDGTCQCTSGYVFGDHPTGICDTFSNPDPAAGQADFCFSPREPSNGYIHQCGGHGSCYDSSCHCKDGHVGAYCGEPPLGCSRVDCGDNSECAENNGNPSCTCLNDYSMNPQTGQCDIPKSACPHATCDPSALSTVRISSGITSQDPSVSACRQRDGTFQGCDCAPGYVDADSANCQSVSGKDGNTARTFKYGCSSDSNDGVQKCDYRLNACEIEQQTCNDHGTPHLIQGSDGSEMCACICDAPYSGQHCEQLDPCLEPDGRGGVRHVQCGACGVCVATGSNEGDYECQCMDDNCANTGGDPKGTCFYTDGRANACASVNCGHGACQYDPARPGDANAYTCVCDGDWGKDAQGHCTVEPCDNADCGTHGVCFNVGDQAVCQCQDGFLYDTETGTCDIQCPWGTHGAGCQNTYDMCNLAALPDHVKSRLADPIGTGQGAYDLRSDSNPGGRPMWATSKGTLINFETGDGGICSTEKDSHGNAYPLISCRGVGDQRWMKGQQTDSDAVCVTEFANIRASNPEAASDRDGWISDELWSQGVTKSQQRGNHPCERTLCNKTPCVGRGSTFKTGEGVVPSSGQEYGTKLTDGTGGVSCTPCSTSSATISIGGDWSDADGTSLARTNCKKFKDSVKRYYQACNCEYKSRCNTGTYIDCGGCFPGWNRAVCVNYGAPADCNDSDNASASGDGG